MLYRMLSFMPFQAATTADDDNCVIIAGGAGIFRVIAVREHYWIIILVIKTTALKYETLYCAEAKELFLLR